MKTKLAITAIVLAISTASVTPSYASCPDQSTRIIADVAVLRPAGLVATAVGSVFFVLSLPFSASTGTIKQTADTLVVNPAKSTFCRPLGNMDTCESVASEKHK